MSRIYFDDGFDRNFIPYKGFCIVLTDGTVVRKDPLTEEVKGPFEIEPIYNPGFHWTFNLRDKEGNFILNKNVRSIKYYPEGYYLIDDNNEDELEARGDVKGGFMAKDYVRKMNVVNLEGKLLFDEWCDNIFPSVGFLHVRKDRYSYDVDYHGKVYDNGTRLLGFGCTLVYQGGKYNIYSPRYDMLAAGYSSAMYTDGPDWNVTLAFEGKETTYRYGQQDKMIYYAHEILIRPDIIAMLKDGDTWYALDSRGQLIMCFHERQ